MLPVLAALAAVVCIAAVAAWWFISSSKSSSASVRPVKLAPQASAVPATAAPPKHDEEDASKPQLLIFFASQTGTAENFAKGLVTEGKKRGFRYVLVRWSLPL